MVVRMRLPTESEPAMTLENVHAAGALLHSSILSTHVDSTGLVLRWRERRVLLRDLNISCEKVRSTSIFVTFHVCLFDILGQRFPFLGNGLSHKSHNAHRCLKPQSTLDGVTDAVLSEEPIDFRHLRILHCHQC